MKAFKKLFNFIKRKREEKWGNYRFGDKEICSCFRICPVLFYIFGNKEIVRKESQKALDEMKTLIAQHEDKNAKCRILIENMKID